MLAGERDCARETSNGFGGVLIGALSLSLAESLGKDLTSLICHGELVCVGVTLRPWTIKFSSKFTTGRKLECKLTTP